MRTHPPQTQGQTDLLAPFKTSPIHIFVRNKVLREQLGVILAIIGFENIKIHPTEGGYLDNARRLAALLIQNDGLFIVNPPLVIYGVGGKSKVQKELAEFFADLSLVLRKPKKEAAKIISRCVPIFPDIQLTQKREKIISGLARYGVTGCFILKPQESLAGLNPNFHRVRMKEQVMERLEEVRAYLEEFLPHRKDAFKQLMQKSEERELSERKQEAEQWMRKGAQAKAKGDFEHAIECFKKAIDLLPQDPEAYLESGRVYVHVKKYPKALLRFSQAEEVAENIPEPNKEIGNTRIEQVRERLKQGESPDSPGIMALLEDAMENYEVALKKAERIQLQDQERTEKIGVENVSRIAGEIMKLDLKAVLGKRHPMVKRFGDLARDSFKKIASQNLDALQPRQILFLGLAAMDEKNYLEAEELFFRAVQHSEVFNEACNELTHLGILIRKQISAQKAIDIYRKLLTLYPHNAAAVCYNLAVSYSVEKNVLESAGAIIQALYIDPSLPRNEMFYNNQHLNKVLHKVTKIFDHIVFKAASIRVPLLVTKSVQLQEKLERLITKNDKRTFRLLQHVVNVMPDFFLRENVASSKTILNYLRLKREHCRQGKLQETREFGDYLEELVTQMRKVPYAKRMVAFNKFKLQCLRVLDTQGDRAEAAAYLGKAAVCHPEFTDKQDFYANQRWMELAKEISGKLGSVDRNRVRV